MENFRLSNFRRVANSIPGITLRSFKGDSNPPDVRMPSGLRSQPSIGEERSDSDLDVVSGRPTLSVKTFSSSPIDEMTFRLMSSSESSSHARAVSSMADNRFLILVVSPLSGFPASR